MRKEAKGIRITALNAAARKGGIVEDMRLTDALALLPTLVTQNETPEDNARVLRNIADWCQCYTPVVGIDGVNGLWLDISGAAHLYGGEDGLLANLSRKLDAIGFANRVGLAETPGASWAVARFSSCEDHAVPNTTRRGNAYNVPPGGILRALAPLPLEALRLDAETLRLLKRFGLTSIGALCAIPRSNLKRRFPSKAVGEAVLHRLDQALGTTNEPIIPIRPVPSYFEQLLFADPLLATESFREGLKTLLFRLCERMGCYHVGAMQLTFAAYHADGGVSRVAVSTAQPSRDTQHLELLFRERIETLNPGFGVDRLVLSADRVLPLKTQQLALAKASVSSSKEEDLARLVDRLANRLGARNVQHVVPNASHIPEQAERRVPALRSQNAGSEQTAYVHGKPLRPFRLLPAPEPMAVIAEIPEGPPKRFTWRRVAHRVVRSEGPERIAPEWWSGVSETFCRTRDYYRIEDTEGRRFWVFREGLYRDLENGDTSRSPSWHMHGLFA